MLENLRRVGVAAFVIGILLLTHPVPVHSTTTDGNFPPACASVPVPIETPPGASFVVLSAVNGDEAVGSTTQNGRITPLIEYYGPSWSPVPSATVAGNALLNGVSGAWAVGMSGVGTSVPSPIIEHRSTTGTWSLVAGADMHGVNANLEAVAVNPKNPNDVWVVGEGTRSDRSPQIPVAEHWNGTSWTNESAIPRDRFVGRAYMHAVSVLGDGEAWAVGEADHLHPVPILAHWTGKRWLQVRDIGANVALRGVAAFPNGNVLVVGGVEKFCCRINSAPIAPFAELWDGKTWTQTPLGFSSDEQGALYSISGLTANNAWAVGSYQPRGSADTTMAISLYWNASHWTVASNPQPQAGLRKELVAVTAIPGRFVKADALSVGDTYTPGGFSGPISLRSEPCGPSQ